MLRAYGTLSFFSHFLTGLKSGFTKSAEPMALQNLLQQDDY